MRSNSKSQKIFPPLICLLHPFPSTLLWCAHWHHFYFSSSHPYATSLFAFFLLPLVRTSIQPEISLTTHINGHRSLSLPPIFFLFHLPFLIMHECLWIRVFVLTTLLGLQQESAQMGGGQRCSGWGLPYTHHWLRGGRDAAIGNHWFISVFIWIRSFYFINLFCKWILRIQLIKFVNLVNFNLLF